VVAEPGVPVRDTQDLHGPTVSHELVEVLLRCRDEGTPPYGFRVEFVAKYAGPESRIVRGGQDIVGPQAGKQEWEQDKGGTEWLQGREFESDLSENFRRKVEEQGVTRGHGEVSDRPCTECGFTYFERSSTTVHGRYRNSHGYLYTDDQGRGRMPS